MTTDHLDEQWDLYDAALQVVGTQRRGDPMPAGRFHLTVAAVLFDENGHVLLQRRSRAKLNHPDEWEVSAGGSALRGEDGLAAIHREVQEELGLALAFTAANRFAQVSHATWIEQWFVATVSTALRATVHRQTSEVQTIEWLPLATAQARLQAQGHADYAAQLAAAAAWLK
ncbi:NUDIX domain-containing protein [Lacticaseibacillus daqingensis]|uniref:NUDIX domain-containing protein n=1 Tax=Lacticaseibacillus daqingensis TaxID=2486014 RepID=UPI000F7B9C3C|nr:NUDIX domain-containing protein [Lacticaseibacillus daqingensis]